MGTLIAVSNLWAILKMPFDATDRAAVLSGDPCTVSAQAARSIVGLRVTLLVVMTTAPTHRPGGTVVTEDEHVESTQ